MGRKDRNRNQVFIKIYPLHCLTSLLLPIQTRFQNYQPHSLTKASNQALQRTIRKNQNFMRKKPGQVENQTKKVKILESKIFRILVRNLVRKFRGIHLKTML